MFDLGLPWWEFMLRAALVYAALLVLIRLSGKRTVGEFTPFDLIVVILLGESMQGALVGDDHSVPGALIAAATLIALNFALGFATARSAAIDRLVEGDPVVVMRNGKVLSAALRKNNVPESDLEEALRREGIARHGEVRIAMLETNGEITVVRGRAAEKP